jgi:hypothetical protein
MGDQPVTGPLRTHADVHALSGIRNQDSSVCPGEDGSCLRPRGHCDRQFTSQEPQRVSITERNQNDNIKINICILG